MQCALTPSLIVRSWLKKLAFRVFSALCEWMVIQIPGFIHQKAHLLWFVLPLARCFGLLELRWERQGLKTNFVWGRRGISGLASHSIDKWRHSCSHKDNSGSHPDNTGPTSYNKVQVICYMRNNYIPKKLSCKLWLVIPIRIHCSRYCARVWRSTHMIDQATEPETGWVSAAGSAIGTSGIDVTVDDWALFLFWHMVVLELLDGKCR